MSKTASLIRKLVFAAIGFPVLVIGLVLIPLPGPGILVSFLGLFILSFEFDWAKQYADKMKSVIHSLLEKAKDKR